MTQAHAGQLAIGERHRVLAGRLLDVPPAIQARLPDVAGRLAGNLAVLEAASRACRAELVDLADPAQVSRCVDGATPAGLAAAGFDAALSVTDLIPGP